VFTCVCDADFGVWGQVGSTEGWVRRPREKKKKKKKNLKRGGENIREMDGWMHGEDVGSA